MKNFLAIFVTVSILNPIVTKATTADICTNPLAYVCADSEKEALNSQKIRSDLYKKAAEKLIKTYPQLKVDTDDVDVSALEKEDQETAKIKFSEVLLDTFEQENLVPTPTEINAIKTETGTFAATYYNDNDLKESVQKINVITTRSQYAELFKTFPENIRQIDSVATFYDRLCGSLDVQATMEKSQNFLIICPGLILQTLGSSKNLSFIIAHELSHAFDAYVTMGTFYQCLKQDTSFKESEFDFNKRREVYADFFGYHFLEKKISTLQSVEQKKDLVKQNLKALCYSDGEKEHPSKSFRINVLLDYPEISQQLGCQSHQKLQCR